MAYHKITQVPHRFRNDYMFTKDGEINDENEQFGKKFIEIKNLVQFSIEVRSCDYKVAAFDSSL